MENKQPKYIKKIDYFFVEALFDEEYKIIVSNQQLEFFLAFQMARHDCETWFELWIRIGNFGRDYVSDFLHGDDDCIVPKLNHRLNDISSETYVLNDSTFPYLQIAAETSEEIREYLSEELIDRYWRTEFGVDICCFTDDKYPQIKKIMRGIGKSIVPLSLIDMRVPLP